MPHADGYPGNINGEVVSSLPKAVKPSQAAIPSGGQYQAEQNQDGTFNVLRVPTVATHDLPEIPGKRMGRRYLEAIVQRHQDLLGTGYTAPLHIQHHIGIDGKRQEVQPAGMFIPREVGSLQVGADILDVIYSDFIKMPADAFCRLQRGELPYTSIEMSLRGEPQIRSLALTDTTAPFCKFANITVREEIDLVRHDIDLWTDDCTAEEAYEPVLICRSDSNSIYALCNFHKGSFTMPTDNNLLDDSKEAKRADEEENTDEAEVQREAAPDALGMLDQAAKEVSSIAQSMAGLAGTLMQVKATMEMAPAASAPAAADPAEPETDETNAPLQLIDNRTPSAIQRMDAPTPKTGATALELEVAKLTGEVASLRQKDIKRDQVDGATQKVQNEINILRTEGYQVDEMDEENLVRFAGLGDDAFKLFTDSFRSGGGSKVPPTTAEAALGMAPEGLPHFMKKYDEQDERIQRTAKVAVAEYNANSDLARTGDLETFVRGQVAKYAHMNRIKLS